MPREVDSYSKYILELGRRDSSIILEGISSIITREEKDLGGDEEILDPEYRVEYLYKLYSLERYLGSILRGG